MLKQLLDLNELNKKCLLTKNIINVKDFKDIKVKINP
jgi:hypothetical protein